MLNKIFIDNTYNESDIETIERYEKQSINFKNMDYGDNIHTKIKLISLICYIGDIDKNLCDNNEEYRALIMSYFFYINKENGYKIVKYKDNLYEFLEENNFSKNNISEKLNELYIEKEKDEKLKALIRCTDFFYDFDNEELLPYYFFSLFMDKELSNFLNKYFMKDIIDLMTEYGMLNVTPLPNEDYFLRNIKFYDSFSVNDRKLMEQSGVSYMYYTSRRDLENKLNGNQKFFFLSKDKEGKLEQRYGNIKKSKLFNYSLIKQCKYNNITKYDYVEFIEHCLNNTDENKQMITKIIHQIMKSFRKILKTDKDINYFKNLILLGFNIRGIYDKKPVYNNILLDFNCYFSKENVIDLDEAYVYEDKVFTKLYNFNYTMNELSKIYISTGILFLYFYYGKRLEDFHLDFMI